MKTPLLLLIVLGSLTGIAQKKEADSLLYSLKTYTRVDTVRMNILLELSDVYKEINPDSGILFSEQASLIAKGTDIPALLSKCQNAKATNLLRKGDYQAAMQLLTTALSYYGKVRNSDVGKIYGNIATAYYQQSDVTNAIEYDKKAKVIYESLNDTKRLISSLNNIGTDYMAISDFLNSLNYFDSALTLATQIRDSAAIVNAYNNMSEIYNAFNDFDHSMEYTKKALAIVERQGNKYLTIALLASVGQIYYFTHRLPEALKYYQKAANYPGLDLYPSVQPFVYFGLGVTNAGTGNPKTAVDNLSKAAEMYEAMGDKLNLSVALSEIGKVYYKKSEDSLRQFGIDITNRYDKALSYQNRALAYAKEVGSPQKEFTFLEEISNIYEKKSLFEQAYYARKRSMEIKDSLLNYDDYNKRIAKIEFERRVDSLRAENDKKQILAEVKIKQKQTTLNAVIAGTLILLIAIIIVFVFYRKQNEARWETRLSNSNLKALLAQMSPHFIYNSLNSIIDYINRNERDAATNFTAKFSNLMRKILDGSEYKQVKLSNELETLELYLQLEESRLQNKFKYSIDIDETINADNVWIPPLLLQPLLENSIKRGKVYQQNNGHIWLKIKQQEDMLHCIVEDNGVGLPLSDSLLDSQRDHRQSHGLRIIRDRIGIINKLEKSKGTVTLYNLDQGTHAEISLPFEPIF